MAEPTNNLNFDDELLSAYVDGELTDAERAVVEERLQNDPAARELVAEIRSLAGTLRSLPKLRVAEDVRSAVLAQVRDKPKVELAEYRRGPLRRLMWPAIAIAAALLLMFTQDDRIENRDVAKIEVHDGEAREDARERGAAAFDVPEEMREPATAPERELAASSASPPPATAAASAEDVVLDAGRSSGVALRAETPRIQPAVPTGVTDAFASSNEELGIVHLTLADLRTGTEAFDRLLVSNGVQVVDETSADRASGVAPGQASSADTFTTESVPSARTLSAPSPATSGFGGMTEAPASDVKADAESTEPEMVLVEAPPKQIEAILFTCANDTTAIEAVEVDPSASGTNLQPEKQRLAGYQQYSRAATNKAERSAYTITPQQQGMITALNSLPVVENQTANSPTEVNQQGWATKFRAHQPPEQIEQLQDEVNTRRNQFYGYAQQQAAQVGDKIAKKAEAPAEQPIRVLFLLHPSEQAKAK
jgi:anti-sigma factor RsiW